MEFTLLTLSPGISFQFKVDAFGLLFATLASTLWIATSFYSIGYIRGLREHKQTRFYFGFALALHGAVGVAFASNLLTVFIFYEILTISTFPLVAHKETPEAIAGGRKYLTYLLTSATLILFAIVFTYSLTGTLNFVPGGFLENRGSNNILSLLFITFILGFGTKAALMPMHEWLPTAMVAPTPVSALLHAVAVVKAGVFCVLRVVFYVFGPKLLLDLNLGLLLAYFASLTILASGMLALAQDNLKKRLAFSTINSLAIIILGAGLSSGMVGLGMRSSFLLWNEVFSRQSAGRRNTGLRGCQARKGRSHLLSGEQGRYRRATDSVPSCDGASFPGGWTDYR